MFIRDDLLFAPYCRYAFSAAEVRLLKGSQQALTNRKVFGFWVSSVVRRDARLAAAMVRLR
jgi:hypothetical protein